ncbi:hypothetical protein F886_00152 [Acinetobacter sp. NIPH 542]|uniref:hypothetical protein n=1 Tax=Acinetobacter sp. NIPH 542 TaxID=1217688 RepID=UPI0002D0D99D|nr:hypothetical protein [Acinetobacter sp. NIPH 542]ENX48351.1 hypothetical protein F886_00152 [Acinetobacter sp. NIPH 542]
MENINFDHRLKTIYDEQGERSSIAPKRKKESSDFLKDIKGEFNDNEKNGKLTTQKNNIEKKTMNFSKIYDFGKTAVNHLSYLNSIGNNISYQKYNSLLVQYEDLSYESYENRENNFISKKLRLDRSDTKIDLASKNEDIFMGNHISKLNASVKQTVFTSPLLLKKNIILTSSEIFIRDYDGDQTELLENIKRQLPDNIDRIWLNGKMIWSKT